MKIIFSIFLALALVSCGGDEWELTPSYTGDQKSDGWLLNKTTGELLFCTKIWTNDGYCSEVTTHDEF